MTTIALNFAKNTEVQEQFTVGVKGKTMAISKIKMKGRFGLTTASFLVLALGACQEGQFLLNLNSSKPKASSKTELVERDVEAPEVFQVTEAGLWDGRPSLGGVWVAHPDVKDPERVIVRNEKTGKFVIGALFRREYGNTGPRLQVSSDAAEALGILAGQPVNLNVTALRREAVADDPPSEADAIEAPNTVDTETLDPVATATAALDKVEAKTPETSASKTNTQKPTSLAKPFIQLGIFSVEKNAQNTATSMRNKGIVPIVKKQSSAGKTFWRVLVGPAATTSERNELLAKIKAAGFGDAYPVTH